VPYCGGALLVFLRQAKAEICRDVIVRSKAKVSIGKIYSIGASPNITGIFKGQ
jgi:hypothetical protein